jgi:hypothetical protein
MAGKYSYQALSSARSTRVILLQPNPKRDADLRCSLKESLLDLPAAETRVYNALSYIWGANTGTRPLFCDDKSILITPNCESALRHLRHARRVVTLWVDAICINQEDLIERAQQVSLMAAIYRQAHEVIIWLGPGSEAITECFSRARVTSFMYDSVALTNFERRVGRRYPKLSDKVFSFYSM